MEWSEVTGRNFVVCDRTDKVLMVLCAHKKNLIYVKKIGFGSKPAMSVTDFSNGNNLNKEDLHRRYFV